MAEFIKWESTARLFRDVVITEKLDGTNACVIFERIAPEENDDISLIGKSPVRIFNDNGYAFAVYAQSRNRLITPSNDNAGFAKWVEKNADRLFHVLGEGRHYGEWWGQGIGRKYDMTEKVFSVFNTAGWFKEEVNEYEELTSRAIRAGHLATLGIHIDAVPVLGVHTFNEEVIRGQADLLRLNGSLATLKYTGGRFSKPEGICIYHKGADRVFKYTFDSNDKHKWELEAPTVNRTFLDKLLRRK